MSEKTVDPDVEKIARQIALDHDLDPDDCRLGYPAWQIEWILELAREKASGVRSA